ncbi:P-loop NTPase fold protein [Micromonospora chersina]|uniref:P-loop NTPase fold protein n=1 Tax=Micromonospora chersina TaxID=47854 RepID=UPI0033A82C64
MTTTAVSPEDPDDVGTKSRLVRPQSGQAAQVNIFHSSTRPSSPRLLPGPHPNFVGREAELAALDVCLAKPRPSVCLVWGMGGIGKTALVIEWAHRVADRFPDGQLFVDMQGYSFPRAPLSPDDASAVILQSLGVDNDQLPVGRDDRLSILRALISSRHMLIVLDNVAAAEQVRPLLSASGSCMVVLTSRRRIDQQIVTELAGQRAALTTIPLTSFTTDEGLVLLSSKIGGPRINAELNAARELVELCGGLPLALQMVAALVGERPHLSLTDTVASFTQTIKLLPEDTDDGSISIGSILRSSYQLLPEGSARLIRFLGLHPGGRVAVSEAAALANVSVTRATALLDDLVTMGMLDRTDAEGYELHPLVHSYLRELVMEADSEQDRLEAEKRLAAVTGKPRQHVDWVDDSPVTIDRLNRNVLAEVIALRLRHAQRDHPNVSLLIHVDGPWGAGKTTLLNLLEGRLTGPPDRSLVISFNAWRHARVEPPWWALITNLRDQLIRAIPWWRRPFVRAGETTARVRRSGASYLVAMVVLVILAVGVIALFRPFPISTTKFSEVAKAVSAGLAVLAGFWSAGKVAAKLLLWDSARGARLFEQSHTNPMQEVTAHFAWLIERSPCPVVFFIDDLDRCDEKFVVALLDAIQNLARDASADGRHPQRAANFVVAADGAWLRRAYERIYENFEGAVDEPGRPLGNLFLDKLFQLGISLPAMGPAAQSGYLDGLLGVAAVTRPEVVDEVQEVRAMVVSSQSEADVLNALGKASSEARQSVIADAITKMSGPEVTAATEHSLQKFAPLLLANPRSMKRFVNTYSVLRILRTLEGNTIAPDALALWTIVCIRWPLLANHLERDADLIDAIKTADAADNVPDPIKSLVSMPAVQNFFRTAPTDLTPDTIRLCCGGQAG